MIDITKNTEDKDKFILGVALKDDENKYVIKYASGRSENCDFTVSSLNQVLGLMEEQYLEYRDDYIKEILKENKRATMKQLIEALLAILGVYLSASMPLPNILKILIICVLVVSSMCYQKEQSEKVDYNRYAAGVILSADEFLKMKDNFKVRIVDPNTGLEEDWYLLTLSDIQAIVDPKLVGKIAKTITPDMKEEEEHNTTEILEKRMKLR